jgi:hypothetical protein
MKKINPIKFCVVMAALAGKVFGMEWNEGKIAPRMRVKASPP